MYLVNLKFRDFFDKYVHTKKNLPQKLLSMF